MKQNRTEQQFTREDARAIVHTPNDAVALALRTIEERRSNAGVGVRLGIPEVDRYLLPARPGELVTILGMTSNYKSGLMQFWARQAASVITSERVEDECVVYVTWEQAIEEMVAFDLASTARISAVEIFQGCISNEKMQELSRVHGTRRVVTPIYLIGHSLTEGKRRPQLTLTAIARGIQLIRDEFGLRPRIVFLDYLQRIVPSKGDDRRMQVFYNVDRCKDMSLALACPVVLGCQANRDTYKEAWGVPGISAGMETSNVEHTSDKALGIWMPKTTYEIGKTISVKGINLQVTDNLLILKVLKQKMGPAGRWFELYVDPATNNIHAMETHQEPPSHWTEGD